VIDGDSLEGLSSIVLSRLGSREVYAEAVGRKKDVPKEISGDAETETDTVAVGVREGDEDGE
jgi:hypothetical protein